MMILPCLVGGGRLEESVRDGQYSQSHNPVRKIMAVYATGISVKMGVFNISEARMKQIIRHLVIPGTVLSGGGAL